MDFAQKTSYFTFYKRKDLSQIKLPVHIKLIVAEVHMTDLVIYDEKFQMLFLYK
jgi:hypothetical protein